MFFLTWGFNITTLKKFHTKYLQSIQTFRIPPFLSKYTFYLHESLFDTVVSFYYILRRTYGAYHKKLFYFY